MTIHVCTLLLVSKFLCREVIVMLVNRCRFTEELLVKDINHATCCTRLWVSFSGSDFVWPTGAQEHVFGVLIARMGRPVDGVFAFNDGKQNASLLQHPSHLSANLLNYLSFMYCSYCCFLICALIICMCIHISTYLHSTHLSSFTLHILLDDRYPPTIARIKQIRICQKWKEYIFCMCYLFISLKFKLHYTWIIFFS